MKLDGLSLSMILLGINKWSVKLQVF